MKASVIIPTRNRIQSTLQAIDSAIVIHSVDEVIVVVDGSEDHLNDYLIEIRLKKYTIVKVVLNNLVYGAQGSRATGLAESKNDIVVFLDSDDLLADGVHSLIEEVSKRQDLVLAYGNIIFNGSRSNFLQLEGYKYTQVLKNLCLCPFSGLAVRKSLIDFSQLNLALPAWQDDDFCIVASKSGLIKFVDVISAENRFSADSISRSRSKQYFGLTLLLEKNKDEIISRFGNFRFILWQLRRLALLLQSASDEIRKKSGRERKIKAYGFIFLSLFLDVNGKIIKRLLRPFFDRIYA